MPACHNISSQHPEPGSSVRRTIKPQTLLQWMAAGDKLIKQKQHVKAIHCYIKVACCRVT